MEIGDLVRLKSGGPQMTVVNANVSIPYGPPSVRCGWFNQEGQYLRAVVPIDALKPSPGGKKPEGKQGLGDHGYISS